MNNKITASCSRTEPVRQKQQAHAFPAHRFKVTDRCTFAVAEIVPAPALSDAAPPVPAHDVPLSRSAL
ncbi:hypothetical protein [Acinetobacter baumannii]|uniref:hypothetical protein n=1 Tax=Acinetobacter baumannii TaxID=470 RepID=UPI00148F48C0|nr:hypothetical protein [Acinetobacter baumannii]NOQ03990.1 hypothetical protein [Acinetobacter baumannii]